jgi:DNA-binding NarL/FixJ family response regulator
MPTTAYPSNKVRYTKNQVIPTEEFLACWDGYIRSQAQKLSSGFARFGLDFDDIHQLGRMALLWIPPEARWSTNYVIMSLRRKMFVPWRKSKQAKRVHVDVSMSEPVQNSLGDDAHLLEDTLVDDKGQSEINRKAAALDLDKFFVVLSRKQRRVMDRVRDGHLFSEIADDLGISRAHVYNVYNSSMLKMRKRFKLSEKVLLALKGTDFRDPNYYKKFRNLPSGRKRLTSEEANKLSAKVRKLADKGFTNIEISKLLGISVQKAWRFSHREYITAKKKAKHA